MSMIFAPAGAAASTIFGSAEDFAILGGSTVTNTGTTAVTGNLGVFPGTAITGEGTISLAGTIYAADAAAELAQSDAATAYGILSGLPQPTSLSEDLGLFTGAPGVYAYSSSAQLTGTLTLNFNGASNEDFVFQIGSTLTTASASSVVVENGNSTDGVFFQVGSSATLGSGTAFAGNILARDSISFDSTAGDLCGRAFALTGAVTMIGNAISNNCGSEDFNSLGFSGGDFTAYGYAGGAFNGVTTAPASPAPHISAPVSSVPEPSSAPLMALGLAGIFGLLYKLPR